MIIQAVPKEREEVPDFIFCATGKSGLGHLRRIANVVAELRNLRQDLNLKLITNAPVSALSSQECKAFASVLNIQRQDMAAAISNMQQAPVVVDTAVLPGLEKVEAPLCLILRETVADRVNEFRLPGGRLWDLVCVPNPADHWLPSAAAVGAKRVEAVGWIFRQASVQENFRPRMVSALPSLLVASGGGGNAETAHWFKLQIDAVVKRARALSQKCFHVAQVAGPRMSDDALLAEAEEYVNVGARLNERFALHDAVVSTAGYNSVLELAQLDVPVLLVPIMRSLDDQRARAIGWAGKLGFAHQEGAIEASAQWLSATLQSGKRRKPCSLDNSGARRCAQLIQELM